MGWLAVLHVLRCENVLVYNDLGQAIDRRRRLNGLPCFDSME